MAPKPISIQLYSVREQVEADFFGVLKQMAAIGYVGVEFAGLYDKKPPEVRKILDALGLKASSTHGPYPTPGNLNHVVDDARALGCDMIVVPYLPRQRFAAADEIKRTAAVLQATAEMLKPHGLRLSYHNHSHEMALVDGQYAMSLLLDSAPALKAQIDTYWASNFGKVDVPAFVKKHASRTPTLHIKDGPLVEGKSHMAAGKGKMDFPPIVAAADPEVLQWVIVELDSCETDMMQAVKDSYAYLTAKGLARGNK